MVSDAALLAERYALRLFRYFRRLTRRRDLAEDLTQETLVRVVRHATRIAGADGEAAWVYRIARSVFLDHGRTSAARADAGSWDEAERQLVEPTQVVAVSVSAALDRLFPADRELLLLRAWAGLSYAELAELYGATLPAVRTRLARARERARRLLAGRPAASRREWRG